MLASRIRSTSSFVALTLALCAACGDDDTLTRSEIPREFAKLACHLLTDCPQAGSEGGFVRALIEQSPKGTCEDLIASQLGGDVARTYDAQIEAGTIVFDAGAAQRCFDALSGSCSVFDRIGSVAACNDAFRGTVENGGACDFSEECVTGNYCRRTSTSSCGGTCETAATAGQACGGLDGPECAGGTSDGTLACEPTEANPDLHCIVVHFEDASAGQPCGDVDDDGDEQTVMQCRPGLFCRYPDEDASTGTCAALLATGATCDPEFDACRGGVCLPGDGGARCVALEVRNEEGESCAPLVGPHCNPLLRLECVSSICQFVGTGTVGAACRTQWESDCDPGLYCDTVDDEDDVGTCAAKRADGAECDAQEYGDSCASDYCDFTSNTCAADDSCE